MSRARLPAINKLFMHRRELDDGLSSAEYKPLVI
jgi:hypothetical protein